VRSSCLPYFEYPENEVWLYPGSYTVYDLDVADEPSVLDVDMREGVDIEIKVDGLERKENVLESWVRGMPNPICYDTIDT